MDTLPYKKEEVQEPAGTTSDKQLKIAFTHHRLVIGGAEQLILLAASGLQSRGHCVCIYTTFHDPNSCLELGRQVEVIVAGRWIPHTLFGSCKALMSIIGMLWLWLCILLSGISYDVIVNDQVSAINPLLRRICKKLIFYCHHPESLLTTRKSTNLFMFYRKVVDAIEEHTLGQCDELFVNSNFTAEALKSAYPSFHNVTTKVLYPPVADASYTITQEDLPSKELSKLQHVINEPFFVSINRFERKKRIEVAIDALRIIKMASTHHQNVRLVIAGGFDDGTRDNIKYYDELEQMIVKYNLGPNNVICMKSISDTTRRYLMTKCVGLLYTPENEHFGMVPCEAMTLGCIVIATNSGGPVETILHNKTGFLCSGSAQSFANAMIELLGIREHDKRRQQQMIDACIKRSMDFNLVSFLKRFEQCLITR